jgi:catechol 2,3-dioxygenase-like lactoylglutathione lyase family enzyme
VTTPSLHRVIVSVSELDRALSFYADVLGLPRRPAAPGFAALTLGDGPNAVELLLHERPAHPSTAGVALSVRVSDVDETVTQAERLGCTIIDRPTDQPWGERLVVLTDLDGHVICLASPLP